MILHQKCNFIGNMYRGYDGSFAKTGAKIGSTLRIRLPNEYAVRRVMAMASQSTTEAKVDLTCNNIIGVDMDFSSEDLTLSLDDFAERISEPAMSTLACNVESDVFQLLYKQVPNLSDEDATAFTLTSLSKARQILTDNLTPDGKRNAILKTSHTTKFLTDTKGLFQDSSSIAEQYREGKTGRIAKADVWENTVFADHQTGTAAKVTGYLANSAAVQSGSSIIVDTGTTTFLKGDIVTFAGVNAVHSETKTSTGALKQFVITADSGASATTLSISPAIVLTGGRQNVSAGVADNVAVSKVGAGASELLNSSLMFHENAFTFATADLVLPDGQDMAARAVMDGIAMSMIRGFNISDRTFPTRLDVLYAAALLRGEMAVRIHADA